MENMMNNDSKKKLAEGKKMSSETPIAPVSSTDTISVSLKPPEKIATPDQALWVAIRNRVNLVSFEKYKEAIDGIFQNNEIFDREKEFVANKKIIDKLVNQNPKMTPDIRGMYAYNILKISTEMYLLLKAGLNIEEEELFNEIDNKEEEARLGRSVDKEAIKSDLENYLITSTNGYKILPYLDRIVKNLLENENLKFFSSIEERMSSTPMIELIWSYWHEEGLLVQTINAISLRFQNIRTRKNDPLAQLELDPLRPLNNLLWGYIQDENNRLSILRRAYEYDHQYGITIYGKAIPKLYSADSRSRFIEAFHNLLYRTAIFYKEDADTTIVSDGFPLLNLLKELHLILTEGQHNQFGDLAWTARAEMLIQQWILSREEIKEFLRRRPMVPYEESWMGTVDTMKKLQGWNDVSVSHFHELAVCGEKILLSVRYGNWSMERDQERAKNWARYWKQEIQSYIHSYRVITGVDITSEPVNITPPSVFLKKAEEEKKVVLTSTTR